MSGTLLLRSEAAAFAVGERIVLQGVDLEIHAGDCAAIVGANGSGKTTLLRGLLGLVPAIRGRVARSATARIGYVPQHETLDPIFPLSALDVALLGTHGDRPAWRCLGAREHDLARKALGLCHALPLAGRRYGELSGGERQRVLLARALASEPDLLFLDEPTAGIDQSAEASILEALASLRRLRPIAIWIVTHHLDAVLPLVDHLASVGEGAVRFSEVA